MRFQHYVLCVVQGSWHNTAGWQIEAGKQMLFMAFPSQSVCEGTSVAFKMFQEAPQRL